MIFFEQWVPSVRLWLVDYQSGTRKDWKDASNHEQSKQTMISYGQLLYVCWPCIMHALKHGIRNTDSMWVDNNGDKRQTEAKQPHFILSKVVYKQELEAKCDSKSCLLQDRSWRNLKIFEAALDGQEVLRILEVCIGKVCWGKIVSAGATHLVSHSGLGSRPTSSMKLIPPIANGLSPVARRFSGKLLPTRVPIMVLALFSWI